MDGINGENLELAPQEPEKKIGATSLMSNSHQHYEKEDRFVSSSKELRVLLTDTDWRDVSVMLHAFADFKMRMWLGAPVGAISLEGSEPVDFAQSAIQKLLTGQRKWNPARCPDVMVFLRGIVRSDLSEAMRKEGRRDRNWNTSEPPPEYLGGGPQAIMTSEEAVELAQLLLKVQREVDRKGDPELTACWNALQNGQGKPQDLSEELGLPVHKIYNARRRLRTLLRSYKP